MDHFQALKDMMVQNFTLAIKHQSRKYEELIMFVVCGWTLYIPKLGWKHDDDKYAVLWFHGEQFPLSIDLVEQSEEELPFQRYMFRLYLKNLIC